MKRVDACNVRISKLQGDVSHKDNVLTGLRHELKQFGPEQEKVVYYWKNQVDLAVGRLEKKSFETKQLRRELSDKRQRVQTLEKAFVRRTDALHTLEGKARRWLKAGRVN